MIVLDEHLQGLGLEASIGTWYRGRVVSIRELRPGVIKDDTVPALLRKQSSPTFVTLNWPHFWHRAVVDEAYCVVCFALPTNRAVALPELLRRLLALPSFKTKAGRMGKVARISGEQVAFYQRDDTKVFLLPLSRHESR